MPRAIFDAFNTRPDRLIITPDVQIFPDLPDAALYAECDLRTIVGAVLWRDDRLIGLLNAKSIGTVRHFTDDELALLGTLGAQAAIAIENTRLVEAERRQRELAEALRDSAAALNSTLESRRGARSHLGQCRAAGANDAASIIVIENQSGRIVRRSGYETPEYAETFQNHPLPLDQFSNLRRIVESGEPLIIGNTHHDPEWVDMPASRLDSVEHWRADSRQGSHAGCPLGGQHDARLLHAGIRRTSARLGRPGRYRD